MPILWLLLAANAVPSTALGYDLQTRHMSAGYDVCSPSATDYDSASVLLGNETNTRVIADCALFAQIAEFLAAEETVAVYHGTTTSAARNILSGGFRGGVDNAVFFGEEYSTAAAFGELRVAETGARSGQVLRFTMPQSLAGDLGLTTRNVLGEFRAAAPIDIPGGSGFERILSGGNIDAFNQALRNGQISVKPLGIRP